MAKRVITGVVGLPILIAVLYFGGWFLAAPLLLVMLVGFWEFCRAFGKPKLPQMAGLLATAGLVVLFMLQMHMPLYAIAIPAAPLVLLPLFLKFKNGFITSLFGFAYVAGLLSAVLIMREFLGLYYVWFIFIAAWGCDTGAYFAGRAFGKRKLAPKLSPKKTVAGAIGGTLTAAILCVVYALIFGDGSTWLPYAIFGIIGAILGQAGDLSASALKRHVGLKDFGQIIPGHGGVLDRFDSIQFVAPFALLFFYFYA